MLFFKSNPNLPDGERARIEFHFQQLVDCLGSNRFLLPVLDVDTILNPSGVARDADQIKSFVGEHLGIDVDELTVQQLMALPVKQSGGGG